MYIKKLLCSECIFLLYGECIFLTQCKQDIQHTHLVKTRHATYAFSQWKHNFVLFSPMPFSLYEILHATLPDELRLSRGWGTHRNWVCQPNTRQTTRADTDKARTSRCLHPNNIRALDFVKINLLVCVAGQTARGGTRSQGRGTSWARSRPKKTVSL